MAEDQAAREFWINGYRVVPNQNIVVHETEEVSINPRSMAVLLVLAQQQGEYVSTQALFDAVWPANHASDNAVYKAVNELRGAFGNGSECIETKPRRGYKLVARVSYGDSAPESQSALPFITRNRTAFAGIAAVLVAVIVAVAAHYRPVAEVLIATVDGHRIGLLDTEISVAPEDQSFRNFVLRKVEQRIKEIPDVSIEWLQVTDTDSRILIKNLELDHIVLIDQLNQELIVQIIPSPTGNAHVDRYRNRPNAVPEVETIVQQTLKDLSTLLSSTHLERMGNWGTKELHAYRFAYEAAMVGSRFGRDAWKEAASLYRQAIAIDNTFIESYLQLSWTLGTLANTSSSNRQQEETLQEYHYVIDQARSADLPEGLIEAMEGHVTYASADGPMESEARARRWIAEGNDPNSPGILHAYARMFAGAKLVEEGRSYMAKAIEARGGWAKATPGDLAAFVTVGCIHDTVECIRLEKEFIKTARDNHLSIYGLVNNYAFLGNFTEAERYLERLIQVDSDGTWAYAARLMIALRKGEIPLGSEALEIALANPKVSNLIRGRIYFFLGDVDKGVDAWRNIEAYQLSLLSEFNAGNERLMPLSVVEDPRYQALLDDLGVGRKWRYYMHNRAIELAELTGIQPSTKVDPPEVSRIASYVPRLVEAGSDISALPGQ